MPPRSPGFALRDVCERDQRELAGVVCFGDHVGHCEVGAAVPSGVVSSTGIAGLTLGGGIAWLMGMYGMAVDNLLSAEVVLASGEVVTAGEDADPDLFWALRGGAGNFGVVTCS